MVNVAVALIFCVYFVYTYTFHKVELVVLAQLLEESPEFLFRY